MTCDIFKLDIVSLHYILAIIKVKKEGNVGK